MGTGCKTVTRTHTKDTDVVTGVWQDGRVGTFRGLRSGKQDYGTIVFGSKGVENGVHEHSPRFRVLVFYTSPGHGRLLQSSP